MKRFLMCALMFVAIFAVCIALQPTEAQAASESELTFTLNSDGSSYSVTDCKSSASGSLTIPSTYNGLPVTSIGKSAFSWCDSLTSVVLPDSVAVIEDFSFNHCTGLYGITVPDSVTSIAKGAFQYCSSLTVVNIGNSVTNIGDKAFYECSNLKQVTIPDSITNFGEQVFSGCYRLNYNLYSGGKYLGNATNPYVVLMDVQYNATDITINANTKHIDDYALSNCAELTGIWVDENLSNYSSDSNGVLFNEDKTILIAAPGAIKSYVIPNSVINIGDNAFYGCSIIDVVIPNGVTTIGKSAFCGCSNLTSVIIPDSVTAIGEEAFKFCFKLTNVTIGNGVTAIGDFAFYYCTDMVNVTIGDGVNTIGVSAFCGCENLLSVTIPSSVTSMDSFPFNGCTNLNGVWVDKNNSQYSSDSFGVLFNKEKTLLIGAPGAIESYVIPDSVTDIDAGAFADCTSLSSVTIPDSITTIDYAVFVRCTSLTSVTIPESVAVIDQGAFGDCTSLTAVTMGDKVTSIDYNAFDGCTSLTDVYYTGTQKLWDEIAIKSDNDPLLNATLHFVDCCTAYGHTEVVIPGVPASCTATGLTEGKKCSVCGEILTAQEAIPVTGHTYDHDFDADCNVCGSVREVGVFEFINYRVVFSDPDTTHKNLRVVIYKLGSNTVADPTKENALQAIDGNPVTKWGAGNINKILITDAGNYVLLLKYNVGTTIVRVPLVIRVNANPKLIIDKNNKITVIDNDEQNANHRVVVYYLGENTVEDIYDADVLKAIDSEAKTHWQKTRINRLALTKGGNYVLHLEYNVGSEKRTVAQQFTVFSIPNLKVDQNNMLIATEENPENKNHRVTVFYLGDATVEDPFDETAVKNAATSSKTYWGLSSINKVEITEGGNYVIHLYYNVGTSAKRTLALDVTLNDRPVLKVDLYNKLVVECDDPAISNYRAFIYNVGDAEVEDIYDEAALEAIATPSKSWGLSAISKKTLTPGTYVIHLHYNANGGAKSTVAIRVTI